MARNLRPEQQWFRLKSNPICRGSGSVRRGELTWDFDVRPSPLSRAYRLRIRQRKNTYPDVFVLSPNLRDLTEGRRLPHVYSQRPVELCLHFPKYDEWTFDKSIAETIVPWAYLWLFYFEHWLATDEWQGGGKHVGDNDDAENEEANSGS
jgi:hypothetical protein